MRRPICLAIDIPDGFAHLSRVNAGIHDWIHAHGAESLPFLPAGKDLAEALRRADAALIQGGNLELRRVFVESGVPAVVVSGQTGPALLPSVLSDDRAIGTMAAEHLRSLGLERMAVYGLGPNSWLSQERVAGFQAVYPDCPVVSHSQTYREWLSTVNGPTGLFVVNDQAASSACRIAREQQIAVPGTLAIMGVDDDPDYCARSPVPLTSIQLDGRRQGWLAAALAASLAGFPSEDAAPAGTMLLTVPPRRVVVRQSTDVLHIADPRLAAFLRLIRDPTQQRRDLSDLCAACGLTRRSCERGLAKYLGSSPARELERLRLDRACRLLESGDSAIASIARSCGYRSLRAFQRAFVRHHGQSPSDWRLRQTDLPPSLKRD